MRISGLIHSALVQRTILRTAALLVPARLREEWLSEWRTELWYAWRSEREHWPRGKEMTAFCLGAFRDAVWLRRNAPLPRAYGSLLIDTRQQFPDPPSAEEGRLLESPARCLVFLALVASANLAIASLLPTAHNVIVPPLHPDARTLAMLAPYGGNHAQRDLLLNLLTLFGVAWLIVPATTSLSLGDYPRNPYWFRRWAFFAAKIALLLPITTLGALNLASIGSSISPLGMQAGLWIGVMTLRWALLDQRCRCPVCLRTLASPVQIGQSSRIFLEWNGTELLCLRGHGLLHVPGTPAIWFSQQRWLYFGPSWSGLFPHRRL
jgi:hypothetical protein